MASDTKKVIFRYENDTYPIVSSVKVNGTPVALNKWDVYFYYNEVDGDVARKIRIEGVMDSRTTGKVKFYPRDKYAYDETNGVAVAAFTVVGEYEFSIVRTGTSYEADAAGTYVLIGGEYIVYDVTNDEHTDRARFDPYSESMTHAVGMIKVGARL